MFALKRTFGFTLPRFGMAAAKTPVAYFSKVEVKDSKRDEEKVYFSHSDAMLLKTLAAKMEKRQDPNNAA